MAEAIHDVATYSSHQSTVNLIKTRDFTLKFFCLKTDVIENEKRP